MENKAKVSSFIDYSLNSPRNQNFKKKTNKTINEPLAFDQHFIDFSQISVPIASEEPTTEKIGSLRMSLCLRLSS